MRRNHVALFLVAVLIAIAVLSPTMKAYNNGIGDSNEQYGCSTDCHTVQSDSVVTMWPSTITLTPGGTVAVTVNVSGAEASNAPLGVMILSALSTSGSLPSDAGWTIVSDPTGAAANNYHEINAYSSSVSWTWTLTAPLAEGIYTLYARELHGDGETYSRDYSAGVTFVVGNPGTAGQISLVITSPVANSEVSKAVIVAASMVPSSDISYAILSIDGVQVDNKTEAPFSWTIDTHLYADGVHSINVTATNATGAHGYDEISVTVNNAGENQRLLDWMWTMAAGTILIIACISVLIVAALLIRKNLMEKEGK
ncbi:MAG: hypothetical protein KJ653_01325 [Candidatus Thermoplasmatota archaeon]|nr:hypothetical protein [Candidatus Thermoplasmatota archaeon]MBU1913854.1 hypothetical protein [Candidatus Thermoplasmatota archaeon]